MIIGNTIYRTKTCDDSFAWARKELAEAPDGSLFIAENLTHAKGRQGRTWEVADGQLLITVLLKPKKIAQIPKKDLELRIKNLNMALALGVLSPILQYDIQLKWPNDFYAVKTRRKVGGEMMDIIWDNGYPSGIIFGFGLNVNNTFAPESPVYHTAATLAEYRIDKEKLLTEILTSLNHWYTLWLEEHYQAIFTAWKLHQLYLGKEITVHLADGKKISGILNDIAENGDCFVNDTIIGFETIFALE